MHPGDNLALQRLNYKYTTISFDKHSKAYKAHPDTSIMSQIIESSLQLYAIAKYVAGFATCYVLIDIYVHEQLKLVDRDKNIATSWLNHIFHFWISKEFNEYLPGLLFDKLFECLRIQAKLHTDYIA